MTDLAEGAALATDAPAVPVTVVRHNRAAAPTAAADALRRLLVIYSLPASLSVAGTLAAVAIDGERFAALWSSVR
jgi:hypothetical protein